MDNRGRHVIADIYLHAWPGDGAVMQACEAAIVESRMSVVACTHKQFQPAGLTAVWILSESHFTLHTYPEHRYLSVDCYTCGDEGRPDLAVQRLLAGLDVDSAAVREMPRGAVA